MVIQCYKIEEEQLKNIKYICPTGKDYNLYLNTGQHWELSKSKKIISLVDNNDKDLKINFRVSRTMFVLKEEKEG